VYNVTVNSEELITDSLPGAATHVGSWPEELIGTANISHVIGEVSYKPMLL
jgi:hypothetical protein